MRAEAAPLGERSSRFSGHPRGTGVTRVPVSDAESPAGARLSWRGADRNRTGVHGFAGRCVATPPRRRGGYIVEGSDRTHVMTDREFGPELFAFLRELKDNNDR